MFIEIFAGKELKAVYKQLLLKNDVNLQPIKILRFIFWTILLCTVLAILMVLYIPDARHNRIGSWPSREAQAGSLLFFGGVLCVYGLYDFIRSFITPYTIGLSKEGILESFHFFSTRGGPKRICFIWTYVDSLGNLVRGKTIFSRKEVKTLPEPGQAIEILVHPDNPKIGVPSFPELVAIYCLGRSYVDQALLKKSS